MHTTRTRTRTNGTGWMLVAAAAALAAVGPRAAAAQGTTPTSTLPGGTTPADTGAQGTQGGSHGGGRRAVGALVTRAGVFRDSVSDALGDPHFDYGQRTTRAWTDRLAGGLTLSVSQPTGDFRKFAGVGVGITANAQVSADRSGVLGLRVEGGTQNYGRSASLVQSFGGVLVNRPYRQVTSNDIFWGSIGPQLSLPLGPVRPYAFASVGVANFATTSRLIGAGLDGRASQSFEITDLSSFATTRGYGGGVRFRIPRGDRTALSVDLGARAHFIRSARYLVPGLVTPDVDPALRAIRGQANFVTYHIGVTAGGR